MDRLESLSTRCERDGETNQQRRQVLSLASPFSLAPGTVRVLEPREGASAHLVEQLCRGEVTGPFMLDSAGMRHLFFDLAAVKSSMRLERPADLVTAYAQKMMAFLLFNRAPRDILMIGLGGFSSILGLRLAQRRDNGPSRPSVRIAFLVQREQSDLQTHRGGTQVIHRSGGESCTRRKSSSSA